MLSVPHSKEEALKATTVSPSLPASSFLLFM
jgi:hypothetical protein